METKEQLVKVIKDWVKIDNEIRILQNELNIRKTDKKKISKELIDVMKMNEIDCFKINDGKIQYKKQNIKKPLSNKILMKLLNDFYNGDEKKATELNNFLLENREETIKENIVRKIREPTLDS